MVDVVVGCCPRLEGLPWWRLGEPLKDGLGEALLPDPRLREEFEMYRGNGKWLPDPVTEEGFEPGPLGSCTAGPVCDEGREYR